MSWRGPAEGFLLCPGVLGAAELERARRALEPVAAAPGAGYGCIAHDVWRRAGELLEVAAAAGLGDLAARFLGGDAVLYQDHYIAKTPDTELAIEWHQDYSYWPLDRPLGLTMWVALDDAGADAGCLRYLPGSHRWGERRAAPFAAEPPARSGAELPPIDLEAAEAGAEAAPARAGDVLIHHPLVWHMSAATRRRRRAWSITWVSPEVRWAPERTPHPHRNLFALESGAALDPERFPRYSPARRARTM